MADIKAFATKNKYVIGAVGVAVVILVIIRIRSGRASVSAAPAVATADTTAQVTDPAGNVCTALDPDSGYCPGSAEDTQYYSEQDSTLDDETDEGLDDSGGAASDSSGYDAAGYPIGSAADLAWQAQQAGSATTATGTTTSVGSTSIETNSEWAAAAVSQIGGDASTVQTAIASVLGGVAVTTAQKNIFLEAVGLLGQPPQGYPAINTTDTASQPASSAGTVAVPNIVGMTAGAAHNSLVAAGLKPVADSGQLATAKVTSSNPKAGTKVSSGSSVVITATNPPAAKK